MFNNNRDKANRRKRSYVVSTLRIDVVATIRALIGFAAASLKPSLSRIYKGEGDGNGFRSELFERFPERYQLDSYNEPLYFEDIEEAAKCVADIIGRPVEPSVEAIDQAFNDYLAKHEDNDTWYSFHEFIEDRDS